ncbi:MAG: hypothetical protein WCX90_05665 [Thiohalomonadaceae bacterium]
MKERYLVLTVLVGVLLVIVVAIFIPGRDDHRQELLPWAITTHADGSSTALGLHLGQSTFSDAEELFQTELEMVLFKSPQGWLVAEGYFGNLALSGFIAKLVIEAALTEDELQSMFERGLRVAALGDGSRKVTLHPDDMAYLRASPISSLTYLPRSRLDGELVEKRFGVPAEKIEEKSGDTVHWLYPEQGLDVVLSAKGKSVLQYVAPRDFPRLVAPLRD